MKIYNSLTRKKEDFLPIEPGRAGIYVCGPTVYDEPHIGHARSAYVFDVIRRYFEYAGYKTRFVRNVTDVDDKIINKARAESEASAAGGAADLVGLTKRISKKYLDSYHDDMEALGIKSPDEEPKATEYIPKMIEFIELLIEKGAAYESEGDVYFDIGKAKDYGKLSNQNLDKMEAGARIAPGEKKRGALDFALWKKAKDREPSWPSPWGGGRPGWHIECSAMSSDKLGDEFDIHGGGIDLIFPHHENEIAQSEGAGKIFARCWVHNGLLTINSEKMAKSLGNFISIKGFLGTFKDPDYLKLLFLNTHYRHPVDYTVEKIEEMKSQKERFLILSDKLDKLLKPEAPGDGAAGKSNMAQELELKFREAMDDDFNTPLALAALFDAVTRANKFIQYKVKYSQRDKLELSGTRSMIGALGNILGLDLFKSASSEYGITDQEISKLVDERDSARSSKDFKRADRIRVELAGKGVTLEDTKDGTAWRRKV